MFKGSDSIVGFGKVTGYYYSYEKQDWNNEQTKCDALIVKNGSRELIDELINLVKIGNGINRLTNDGKLILNLNIPHNFMSAIKLSSASKPITLDVLRVTPTYSEGDACTSFVEIINTE